MKNIFTLIRRPGNLSARGYKFLMNIWPPYWGSGIFVERIAPDFKRLTVVMKMAWYNRNAVGTHFGGSLYAMTDPFFMLMLMGVLGPDYIVWDKSAAIDFIRPGKGRVRAEFFLTDRDIGRIRQETGSGEKFLPTYSVDIVDEDGEVVARVRKTLYVRKKENRTG
ncbi:DUF4442 domain-containing protein [Desulfospira joergensenii]|uniref:DUF4442 domain-containing protein n=1 Tax=Desulfospira joergensenii TaxID=53329 RepID=UPI0003B5F344|nr:DUF4442 domain-containing protein [Desulfospira joergensenii]